MIYNAWWFEAIMVILINSLVISLPTLKKKMGDVTTQIYLDFIIVGLQPYYCLKMLIRENAENQFYSDETFFDSFVDGI
jgi:hypothetical protein